MKKVVVNVTSDDKRDNSNTSIVVETDRGAGYVRTDGRDVVTNKDKDVEFNLRPGQRLVIQAYEAAAVQYDRDQGAAFKVSNQVNDAGKLDDAKDSVQNQQLKKEREAEKIGERQREQGLVPNSPQSQPFRRESPGEDPNPDGVRVPAQSRSEQDARAGASPNPASNAPPAPAPAQQVKPAPTVTVKK